MFGWLIVGRKLYFIAIRAIKYSYRLDRFALNIQQRSFSIKISPSVYIDKVVKS